MDKKAFEGTVCLVWYRDSKQKFKYVTSSKSLKDEITRLRNTGVPDSAMVALGINWETQEILTFAATKEEEKPNDATGEELP